MRSKAIKCLGFTLIELLITVAIVGILLAIAIPSFTDMMKANRLTSITNNLITSLSYARNEAVKRGAVVTMDNKGAAGDWSSGWDICVDVDTLNSCADATDTILRTVEAIPDGYAITTGDSDYKDYAGFKANGLPTNTSVGDTFNICEGGNTGTSRHVAIIATGRANLKDIGDGSC